MIATVGAPVVSPRAWVSNDPDVSVEQCDQIARLDDAVARNYDITHTYTVLSRRFDDVVDHGRRIHPNWCTFASHASNTVGRTIRGEDTKWLRMATKAGGLILDIASAVVGGATGVSLQSVKMNGQAALDNAQAQAARGNQKVFEEIGPEFARYIQTFKGDERPDPGKLSAYLQHFGPEQDKLAEAFTDYTVARFATDERQKSQLMWAANCLIAAHEQARLQDQIAGALPPRGRGMITNRLALELPDQTVYLGSNVPLRKDGQAYPETLRHIEVPAAGAVMKYYRHQPDSLKGSAADDWGSFDDRMNYIVDLFRSNGDNGAMFADPKVA